VSVPRHKRLPLPGARGDGGGVSGTRSPDAPRRLRLYCKLLQCLSRISTNFSSKLRRAKACSSLPPWGRPATGSLRIQWFEVDIPLFIEYCAPDDDLQRLPFVSRHSNWTTRNSIAYQNSQNLVTFCLPWRC